TTSFGDGIQYAWIDPDTGQGTLPECDGARQYPFVDGYLPQVQNHCYLQRLEHIFGGGNSSNGAAQPAR
ncbi:MAG TPA: hypothetical protein VFP92_11065, partial [Rhodanobacteraceae bacterium]|nr:hypothetical protein [Rhodanobacteraceae bacterium]